MSKGRKLGAYLEPHGNGIRVVVSVPAELVALGWKTKLKESLGTDSPALAERKKGPVLLRLFAVIEAGLKEARSQSGRTLTDEALEWREEINRAEDAEGSDEELADRVGLYSVLLAERAEEVEAIEGAASAQAFFGVASGTATPLKAHLEAFLSEVHLSVRYKDDIRRAVSRLAKWCAVKGVPETLESFTRKAAGRFVSTGLVPTLGDRKTINKEISCLSSYWKWLTRRGHLEEASANPWRDQGFEVGKGRTLSKDGKERAFTAAEAAALLHGPADPRMRDIMWIAALSGMRIDEVCRLQVQDCTDGVFKVNARRVLTGEGKTDASERAVPIHSKLLAIVGRLSNGKAPEGPLIDGLPDPVVNGKRKPSAAAGQAFTRYRRSLSIDDRIEGRRRARVNFHSWRRWFVTTALAAGQPLHLVSAAVGHEEGRKSVTVAVYNPDGPLVDQLRAVVESVKPPPPKDQIKEGTDNED